MTLGRLALHVATIPGALATLSTHDFDVKTAVPPSSPASAAELLPALEASLAEARGVLGRMREADLATPWRLMDGDREIFAVPRETFLRSTLLNHWYHHRGQLTVYLRLLEVPLPAIYGPSADENPFV